MRERERETILAPKTFSQCFLTSKLMTKIFTSPLLRNLRNSFIRITNQQIGKVLELIVNCVLPPFYFSCRHNVGVENICEKCRDHLRDGVQLLEVIFWYKTKTSLHLLIHSFYEIHFLCSLRQSKLANNASVHSLIAISFTQSNCNMQI